MMTKLKVAMIQMVSGPDPEQNWNQFVAQLPENNESVDLLVLPEMFGCFGVKNQRELAESVFQVGGIYREKLAEIAVSKQCYLIAGTLPLVEGCQDPSKVRAASLVYSPQGEEINRYDKIHLFDVQVGDAQGRYGESETFEPGDQISYFELGDIKVGQTVCYDLRFPELFQSLRTSGCDLIVVPSAFTYKTGAAHWLTLLKARAIETQCFIVAPGQGGDHDEKRSTWGHSVIISPWGEVIAELDQGPGFISAELDLNLISEVRGNMPLWDHKRL